MNVVKTFMSPVHYRLPVEGARDCVRDLPQLRVNDAATNVPSQVYWLDALLGSGLRLPDDAGGDGPPFVLLLAGGPGTGKSTFALELCYNLARNPQDDSSEVMSLFSTLTSVYFSSEHTSSQILEHVQTFGWDTTFFKPFKQGDRIQPSACTICGSEILDDPVHKVPEFELGRKLESKQEQAAHFFSVVRKTWNQGILSDNFNKFFEDYLHAIYKAGLDGDVSHPQEMRELLPPDVVVIDSLNILLDGTQESCRKLVDEFLSYRNQRPAPKFLILVIDGFDGEQRASAWEYLADAAFRFDSTISESGYFQRTFQIMKIKSQPHALGKQVLKIYPGARTCGDLQDRKFARTDVIPYLVQGGGYVFPSVHWHLSNFGLERIARVQREDAYSTGITSLDSILAGSRFAGLQGFPAKSATALVGLRGGMKSHLAYSFLVRHALGSGFVNATDEKPKNVLLISLRDDLDSTKQTLREIAREEKLADESAGDIVQELIDGDRLEIIYNRPGYISPNEMFHRIYVALARKRSQQPLLLGEAGLPLDVPSHGTAEVVLVNGLDHLESRFPLCSREQMFVPAIVSLFRRYNVCLVVTSSEKVHESAAAEADLVLEFQPIVGDSERIQCDAVAPGLTVADQKTRVTAVRVPVGQIGGRWGVLSRREGEQMRFYPSQ